MEKTYPQNRFAVSRLHLPDGRIMHNHVVEPVTDAEGNTTYKYYPLDEELPFTEWRGGDFYL